MFPIPNYFQGSDQIVAIPSKKYPQFHYKVNYNGHIWTYANNVKDWPTLREAHLTYPYYGNKEGNYLAEDWCIHPMSHMDERDRANYMCFCLEHYESWIRGIGSMGLCTYEFRDPLGYVERYGSWYPVEKWEFLEAQQREHLAWRAERCGTEF